MSCSMYIFFLSGYYLVALTVFNAILIAIAPSQEGKTKNTIWHIIQYIDLTSIRVINWNNKKK